MCGVCVSFALFSSQFQVAFGICNVRVKYIDDAGDNVNIDSQGMHTGDDYVS